AALAPGGDGGDHCRLWGRDPAVGAGLPTRLRTGGHRARRGGQHHPCDHGFLARRFHHRRGGRGRVLAVPLPLVDRVLDALVSAGTVNEDRRILLRNLFYGAVGIAVLGIGYANVRRFTTALATREGTRAASEVTNVSDFYVVSKNLAGDPVVDGSTWRLNLPTRALTYQELLAVPLQQQELTLECISNDVGGPLISNGIWKGPRGTDGLAPTTHPAAAA